MIERNVLVDGMHGLGDNIYQRPIIKALARRYHTVYLETPWPQLYQDLLNVRPLKTNTSLRCQQVNEKLRHAWSKPPSDGYAKTFKLRYEPKHFQSGGSSILDALSSGVCLDGDPLTLDLPPRLTRPPVIDTGGRPLALVRPSTIRAEWCNVARAPRPTYLRELSERLYETHFVVSVASLEPLVEWLEEPKPKAHLELHRGELSTMEVLELLRRADCALGGVGWLVPAATALGVPTFIVLGGNGKHNAPDVIVDRRLSAPWIGFARPLHFCMCSDKAHTCDKRIVDLHDQFDTWAQGVNLWSPTSRFKI